MNLKFDVQATDIVDSVSPSVDSLGDDALLLDVLFVQSSSSIVIF